MYVMFSFLCMESYSNEKLGQNISRNALGTPAANMLTAHAQISLKK